MQEYHKTRKRASKSRNNLAKSAIWHAKCGRPVFPCHPRSKKPLTQYGFKDATTDLATVGKWWRQWPDANIGIATGAPSGIWVLDIDGDEGEATLATLQAKHGAFPDTVTVISGGGGKHFWFKMPPGQTIRTSAGKIGPGVDVRGDGGYIIVPPSIHPNGTPYVWSDGKGLSDLEPAKAPAWLLELVTEKTVKHTAPRKMFGGEKPAGTPRPRKSFVSNTVRYAEAALESEAATVAAAPGGEQEITLNSAAFKVGGYVATRAIEFQMAFDALVAAGSEMVNQPGKKPWSKAEIEDKVRRGLIHGMHTPRTAPRPKIEKLGLVGDDLGDDLTQRDKLIEIGAEFELWRDADGKAYATVTVGNHQETHALGSTGFKRLLLAEYGQRYPVTRPGGQIRPSAPNTQGLVEAMAALEAMAARGPQHDPRVRIAGSDGKIFIDLGDPEWTVVEIDKSGWRIAAAPPVRFIRPPGFRPLPVPKLGGSIELLRPFLNVGTDDGFTLAVGWLVGALAPQGPFPLLFVNGEPGAAKSTLCRILRRLIDPNLAELRSAPRDERDLAIAARNSHVIALDNISFIRPDLADAMCRIATNSGFATRTLFKNDEETIISVCRPQVVNGIPDLATRSDLVDRSIVLVLPALEDGSHMPEEVFWKEFEAVAPLILGALYEAVACALRRLPTLTLPRAPRMADFAKRVEAAAPALGWDQGVFLGAYEQNRASAVELSVDADPVSSAVRAFVVGRDSWTGTATTLLEMLALQAPDEVVRTRSWPKAAAALSNRLRRAAPALRRLGVVVELRRQKGRSHITLGKVAENGATRATRATQSSEIKDLAGGAAPPGGGAVCAAGGAPNNDAATPADARKPYETNALDSEGGAGSDEKPPLSKRPPGGREMARRKFDQSTPEGAKYANAKRRRAHGAVKSKRREEVRAGFAPKGPS